MNDQMDKSTEDRIAAMLTQRASDVTPRGDEALNAIAQRVAGDRRRGFVWRPIVALGSAAALIAAVVVGTQTLGANSELQVEDPGFATAPPATGGETPVRTEGWTRLPVDPVAGSGTAYAAAAQGQTVVVVGTYIDDAQLTRPLVWRSTDGGTTWDRQRESLLPDGGSAGGEALDIAVMGDGFIAVGSLGGKAFVWTSEDDGQTWRPEGLEMPIEWSSTGARSVAVGVDGTPVVVGERFAEGSRFGAIWRMDPETGWVFEADEASFAPDPETVLYEVDALPAGGFVTRGYGPESTGGLAATWDSVDGRDWVLRQGANLAEQNIDAVMPESHRYVAVSVGFGGAMVQASDDAGESWEPYGEGWDLLPADGGTSPRVSGLVRIGERYYAPGSYESGETGRVGAIWSWIPDSTEPDRDDIGGSGAVEVVALPNGRVLLVGTEQVDDPEFGGPQLAVWSGWQDPTS